MSDMVISLGRKFLETVKNDGQAYFFTWETSSISPDFGRVVIKFVERKIAFDHRVPSCDQYIFNGHIGTAHKRGPYDQRLIFG
jgi:hypothetical protein